MVLEIMKRIPSWTQTPWQLPCLKQLSNIIGRQEELSREVVKSHAYIFPIIKKELHPKELAFLDRIISAEECKTSLFAMGREKSP